MPEWLVERGIGETRAALVEDGAILESRTELDGAVPAGTVLEARLIGNGRNGRNALARDSSGTEYLLPKAPAGCPEGATLTVEVVREAIPGAEPWKRPLARASERRPTPTLPLELRLGGPVRQLVFPAPGRDELAEAGWEELVEQASTGTVEFPGGALRLYATPAMTLIDVDGWLPPEQLAGRGAAEAARAIRRLDIGGSIGIDLPTVAGKSARQSAAQAIDQHLPQPFERTAVNGFGFVQIVRPRSRPSLLEIWSDRPAAEARRLLRRVAREGHGAKLLVVPPAIASVLDCHSPWLDSLSRQIGGSLTLRSDPSLPIHGAYAEAS